MHIEGVIALMIPILGVTLGIGLACWAVYVNYRKRKDLLTLYHQERMAAIDKGIELPPLPDAFFDEPPPRPGSGSPHRYLLKGLVWLFLGLAAIVPLYCADGRETASWGLIPAAIGAAYLIYYFAVGRKQAEQLEAAQAAKQAATPPPRSV